MLNNSGHFSYWLQYLITSTNCKRPQNKSGSIYKIKETSRKRFGKKIWVIGGSDGNKLNDIWASSDGLTWEEVTTNAPFSERSFHTSVVFDDKIWVIGGWNGGSSFVTNDVWSSIDGITWLEASPEQGASFPARFVHTSLVFDNKIWVIGGSTFNPDNDVLYMD